MTNATQGRLPDGPEQLRESLASMIHAIWAHWMRYQFSQCVQNADGSLTIPTGKVTRWTRQKQTDYADLTEREKESDRDQADKILAVLSASVAAPEPETPYSSPYSTALPDRTGYWYRLYIEPTTGNWIDVVESVTVVDCVDGSKKAMLEWRDSVGNLKFTELVESYDCWWAEVVMPPWPIAEMDQTFLGPLEDMEQL